MTNYLRPDEIASRSEIESNQRFDQKTKGLAKKAIGLGLGATGAGLSSKILPFLSEYIPVDLALKGISKVSPKTGEFLRKGMEKGLDLKDGFDYIKQSLKPKPEVEEEKQTQQNATNPSNIIEQYSPELHQFIKGELAKGRPHLEAGALAQVNDKFKKVIKKIEEDHKTPFSTILDTTYGGGQHGGSVNPSQKNQQDAQQSTQQPGQGQQALMSILQKIQQQRGE